MHASAAKHLQTQRQVTAYLRHGRGSYKHTVLVAILAAADIMFPAHLASRHAPRRGTAPLLCLLVICSERPTRHETTANSPVATQNPMYRLLLLVCGSSSTISMARLLELRQQHAAYVLVNVNVNVNSVLVSHASCVLSRC